MVNSLILSVLSMVILCGMEEWQPKQGPLMTEWAGKVSPEDTLPEYPRPQMVRKEWMNLNGLWQFSLTETVPPLGKELDDRILVPFPPESALSGVMEHADRVWYRRSFNVDSWIDQGMRVLIHFGAVDWEAKVWVNGKKVGRHRGGYTSFTFDITEALRPSGGQEIVVSAWDPTDEGYQPRGKQVLKPHGIWYTPVTGIWQTVWLEPVPASFISDLKIIPDVDRGGVEVSVRHSGGTLRFEVGDEISASSETDSVFLEIPDARLWSPEDPHLYDLTVKLVRDGQVVDQVASYFGMRKVSVQKAGGVTRIFLNNEPCFMIGPLDQGFWPDGIYTAPTDEALRYDIEVTKKLGFNMARKHVKIEPARWYYWADKLGLLVWQDMPSGNNGVKDGKSAGEPALQFEDELKSMVDTFHNHPSIVMWVVFNEGWGQYDTERLTQWVMDYDSTRLVNCASGWTDKGVGHVHDIHAYPGPASPDPEPARAAVLGEFGGLGLAVKGHTWQDDKNWGYRTMQDRAELTARYVKLLEQTRQLVAFPGLSAAVYTQTTDVEIEVNGLMTYDRAMIKMDADAVSAANQRLHLPPPKIETVLPASNGEDGFAWRYTFDDPGDGWFEPGFDDSAWQVGKAGFGGEGTPGARLRTPWTTETIWIRRAVELEDRAWVNPHFFIHHDEDAVAYVNGVKALEVEGYTTSYRFSALTSEGAKALRTGRNVLAVHCRQTGGGQYIDVGIMDMVDR